MNMVTHTAGGGLAIAASALLIVKASLLGDPYGIVSASVYGAMMILVFTISAVYHGMHLSTGKLVMRVIDHCDIYFLIAATYTPILLVGIRPLNAALAFAIFGVEWGSAVLGAVLNAIDLKKYSVFSIILYLVMGWCILVCVPKTIEAMTLPGFLFLLGGGIAYSLGAVFYGFGKKKRYAHSVFHLFVVLGAALQFVSIYFYLFR